MYGIINTEDIMSEWQSNKPMVIIVPTDNIVRKLFEAMASLPPEANTSPDEAMLSACAAILYREHIDYAHATASFRARLHMVEPNHADAVTMLYAKFILELVLIYSAYGLWDDNNECHYHFHELIGNDIMLHRFEDRLVSPNNVHCSGTPRTTYTY
jgi:hypothetical protein